MTSEENTLNLAAGSLHDLLAGPQLSVIEELLPAYLLRQRWFGAKSLTIASARVREWVELPGTPAAIVFLQVAYAESAAKPDVYQLPLALTNGAAADAVRAKAPASILCSLATASGPAILHDATAREDVRQALLSLIETQTSLVATPTSNLEPRTSNLQGHPSAAFTTARGSDPLPARTGSAEQSNTSILYGNSMILKLFRRLQPGENPDAEIGRFLTEVAHYPRIPAFLGDIRATGSPDAPQSEQTTLAMLQGLIENQGDGWQFTLDQLARYYEAVAPIPLPADPIDPIDTGPPPSFLDSIGGEPLPAPAREYASPSLEAAALLGRRTAELHLALATPSINAAFQPEPFTATALADSAARVRAQIALALEALKRALPSLPAEPADAATLILSRRTALLAEADAVAQIPPEQAGLRIRIHGDYHLGQVLCARGDYFILDFEGEPARPLTERRAKQSPLRDVAGMLRSFSYAAYAALDHFTQRHPNPARTLEPWALLWQHAVSTQFLAAWRTTIASDAALNQLAPPPVPADRLLKAYLLEKALYELLYELNNRPAWVHLPLAGILALF